MSQHLQIPGLTQTVHWHDFRILDHAGRSSWTHKPCKTLPQTLQTRQSTSTLHLMPRRPKTPEIEIDYIDKRLAKNIIKPEQTKLEALIVFVPEKGRTTQFGADYRKLNAVPKLDSSPMPYRRMYWLPKQRNRFINVDTNSEYWQI